MKRETSSGAVGYIGLLRSNSNFRRLWIGQFVSQTGDWFNSVALFTLLLNLTGSGAAVGYILILKLLPTFFVSPLAGVVADRFNRKTIMIASDLLRALLVLGFLLVRRPDQVWIVYTLTALEIVLTSFFEPAKSAAIPELVTRDELISANGLSGAAWSVTLALGAALGGLVTGVFGRDVAFIIDALTFLISAAFISLTRFSRAPEDRNALAATDKNARLSFAEATGITDFIEGTRFLKANPRVAALLLVKPGWGIGGGVLLLLTIFGKQIFPIGGDGSISIGLLYAARGFGALIGPIIAQAITGRSPRVMRRAITIAFFVSMIFYLMFAHAAVLALAALFVVGAHMGGSIQWVYSTTLIQLEVPNRFLGRVFAIEMALVTLLMSLSTFLTGWGLDFAGFSPRTMATLLGFAFMIPGLAWFGIQHWMDGPDRKSAKSSQVIEAESAD